MKIREDFTQFHSDDFWYDLTIGGYIKPEIILDSEEDIKKLKDAIALVKQFEDLLEDKFQFFEDE